MKSNEFIYPVKWIGNKNNPKLIFLLLNPGSDPKNFKEFAEYKMEKLRLYTDEGMDLNEERKVCKWWEELLKITDKYNILPSEILALEFYPYHTSSGDKIPKLIDWNEYAKKSLEKNIEFVKKIIKEEKVLIFGYYWGRWCNKIKELRQYPKFAKGEPARARVETKAKTLDRFLKNYVESIYR